MQAITPLRCSDESHSHAGGGDLDRTRSDDPDRDPSQSVQGRVLIKWSDRDPQHPRNWTTRKKITTTIIASAFTLMPPVASTMVAPGLGNMMQDLNITSKVEGQLTISVFVLAYAVGPMFLAPLSEIYGRVPVLQASNAWFFCFNIGCGFAKTKEQMFVFRFLSGLGGSAPLAIGGGIVSDCFHAEKRAQAVSLYSLTPLLGPAIGPIAGGFMAQYTTWRWTFWATSAASAAIWIAAVFFLQESFAPKILQQRAAKLRKEKDGQDFCTEFDNDYRLARVLTNAIVRPFRFILTQPIVQVMALYQSYLNGVVYLMLSTFPRLWRDTYGQSISTSGLNYISFGIGLFLGAQIAAPFHNAVYAYLKKKNDGREKPEFRVPVIFVGATLVPIGLFWYGWSAQERSHWVMPNIGAGIYAAGTIICFQSTQAYIFDAYTKYAASATAATMVLRSLAGFGFPLFAPVMYNSLDYGWGNSLLGFLGIGIGITAPILFWIYGERLRLCQISREL
jgi:multidrug resistance protein